MFAAFETSLIALIDGAVAGAPVFGTWDFVDFTAPGAPALAVKVSWGGYAIAQQLTDAVRGDQRFSVSVLVNQPRVNAAARAAAAAGIGTLIERLIGWRPVEDTQAAIETAGEPGEEAGLWIYTINLTIPDYRLRAS